MARRATQPLQITTSVLMETSLQDFLFVRRGRHARRVERVEPSLARPDSDYAAHPSAEIGECVPDRKHSGGRRWLMADSQSDSRSPSPCLKSADTCRRRRARERRC